MTKRTTPGTDHQCGVNKYSLQDGGVEGRLQIAQVLADHLFAEALSGDEEAGHAVRRLVQEAATDQVVDAALRLGVEQVQADAVLPLTDDLRHLAPQRHGRHVRREHDRLDGRRTRRRPPHDIRPNTHGSRGRAMVRGPRAVTGGTAPRGTVGTRLMTPRGAALTGQLSLTVPTLTPHSE